MNRAFLVVLAPALFVLLLYLGAGFRLPMPILAGVVLLAAASAAYGLSQLRRRGKNQQSSEPPAGR
jgi:hypothetical protein